MSNKEFKDEDIAGLFIPQKSAQDNLLATAAISMIVGSVVLIGIAPSLSQAVRYSLVISVSSLTISLFLLLWFNPRLEMRSKLMKTAVERRVKKVKEDIQEFTKFFYTPLFRTNLINNLQALQSRKIKSKKQFDDLLDEATNKAIEDSEPSSDSRSFTTQMFYRDFFKDMYFMDKKIFHTPLEESYGKLKHFFDIFSFRFRYHFFVVGVVALAFSIITHLLLK